MPQIDYFFGTVSPFAYLAGIRLEAIAAAQGAAIRYKPVDLGALFARTGGLALKDRHESRRAYRLQELRRQARKAGLPLNERPAHWPTNPAPSSYAIIAAQRAGGGDLGRLVHGLMAACWAEEKDIAEDGTIREALGAAGFAPDLAERGMLAAAEEYAANGEEAAERGVFGAPFYIVGEERFWGQDRLDDLEAHLAGRL